MHLNCNWFIAMGRTVPGGWASCSGGLFSLSVRLFRGVQLLDMVGPGVQGGGFDLS